ncbi:MAG: LamG domain-containing protein [Planctomycetes bacterium]|nr:LamG domain-containing protein [Planctomycetota bacterium]
MNHASIPSATLLATARTMLRALAPLVLLAAPSPCQPPVADYLFDGDTVSSTPGASLMVLDTIGGEIGFGERTIDGFERTVCTFSEEVGLALSPVTAAFPQGAYTVVLLFRFETVSGYRKVLDFKGGTDDGGLYVQGGNLGFYPFAVGFGAPISPSQWIQVVLTRDEAGNVAGYVDGAPQFQFADSQAAAVVGPGDELRFFQDDSETTGEESAGSVARLRLYPFALSEAQVGGLDRIPCPLIPDAAANDLAVNKIRVLRRVKLTAQVPSRTILVKVEIQNRGRHEEVIPDLEALANLVALSVDPIGESCTAPTPVLAADANAFPLVLPPRKKLKVPFALTIDCASDPLPSTSGDPGHEDLRISVDVFRQALGEGPDMHPADDVCPRPAGFLGSNLDPCPSGTFKDKGCGPKFSDGTVGADILIDVLVR